MMDLPMGLEEVRRVSLESLADWAGARTPGALTPQWWHGLLQSIEMAVSPLKSADRNQRISDLKLGASAITLAVERNYIDAPLGGYWLLRLAAAALRLGLSANDLPAVLSPDGSAAWALERLPMSREEALMSASRRKEEYSVADESFFASADSSYDYANQEPGPETRALLGTEKILSALPWVIDHLTSPQTRREVRAWLSIEDEL